MYHVSETYDDETRDIDVMRPRCLKFSHETKTFRDREIWNGCSLDTGIKDGGKSCRFSRMLVKKEEYIHLALACI